jgi:hypothetical protein
MKLKDRDIMELNDFFEDTLNRSQNLNRQQRLHLRKRIRNELFCILGWETVTVPAVISRWEERLSDVFSAMPYGFEEDLFKLLSDKLRAPLLKARKVQTPHP